MLKKIKERIEKHKNIDSIFSDRKLIIKHMSIIFLLMIIPSFYLNEDVILNDYKNIIDNINIVFPAFENRALIAKEMNLYYFCSFQAIYSLIIIGIIYLISFYDFSKFYISSLNIINFKTNIYKNETIKENKSQIPDFFMYILNILILILSISFLLFFEISIDSALTSMKAPFQSKISITLFYSLFAYIGVFLSFITLETIAKLYNLIKK